LMQKYQQNFAKIEADTSICPTIQTVYHLYYNPFKSGDKRANIQDYLQDVQRRAKKSTKCKTWFDDSDFVVAAIPALMERSHKLDTAGGTIFIDTRGNVDRVNCKLFVLLCDSSVGG